MANRCDLNMYNDPGHGDVKNVDILTLKLQVYVHKNNYDTNLNFIDIQHLEKRLYYRTHF